jgi:hypothetical protein
LFLVLYPLLPPSPPPTCPPSCPPSHSHSLTQTHTSLTLTSHKQSLTHSPSLTHTHHSHYAYITHPNHTHHTLTHISLTHTCTPWRPSGVPLTSLGLRRLCGFCVAGAGLGALQRGRMYAPVPLRCSLVPAALPVAFAWQAGALALER